MHDLLSHDTTRTLRLARYSNPRDVQTTRRGATRDAHTRQPASTCTAHTSRRTSHISPTDARFERLLARTRRSARALQKRHAHACTTPRCTRCRALAARRDAADARGRQPQPSCHRDTPIVVSRPSPTTFFSYFLFGISYFLFGRAHQTCAFFPISFLGRAWLSYLVMYVRCNSCTTEHSSSKTHKNTKRKPYRAPALEENQETTE